MAKEKDSATVITLTTDFGLQDPFVGVMKGVIRGISPEAAVIDICHDLTAFQIPEAGFTLAQTWPFFPKGTIHVVVIDPGVGTSRRPILVEAFGQYFIGPDNGVFSMVYRAASAEGGKPAYKVREITNDKLFLKDVSATFHGRDIFAPTAAHMANGVKPSKVGKKIDDALRQDWDVPVRTGKRFWSAAILKQDRFGNLITNLRGSEFDLEKAQDFEVQAGLQRIQTVCRSYAEAPSAEPFLIVGSSGYWEVALNQASAAKKLGLRAGSPVELVMY
jgi:hypothetical protein